jgi:hypothetical protein
VNEKLDCNKQKVDRRALNGEERGKRAEEEKFSLLGEGEHSFCLGRTQVHLIKK